MSARYHGQRMAALKRILLSLTLDALIVVVLVFPDACTYLRWPLLGLYALLASVVYRRLSDNRWIVTIVRDSATRLAHGLEHATIAILCEDGLPAVRGFTHGHDRFMVALEAGHGHRLAAVRDAATRSIRRILGGERSLAYQPGCGTSEVVSAVTLWIVYASSMMLTLVVGGSIALFFALSVIVFRLWLAFETPLGLLAQRLWTVSTAFSSASVVDVREATRLHGHVRPDDETWFEVVVEVQVSTAAGGPLMPVEPGVFV